MKNIVIFEKIKDQLYSASFDPDGEDELDRAFSFWRNREQLRAFFDTHQVDLKHFAFSKKARHAALEVMIDSKNISRQLIEMSKEWRIADLFKPLDNREDSFYDFQKVKMKGTQYKSMLRLYAVHLSDYFVSGSAIKLTNKMDRPHLRAELHKLELVSHYLRSDGRHTNFVYMDI